MNVLENSTAIIYNAFDWMCGPNGIWVGTNMFMHRSRTGHKRIELMTTTCGAVSPLICAVYTDKVELVPRIVPRVGRAMVNYVAYDCLSIITRRLNSTAKCNDWVVEVEFRGKCRNGEPGVTNTYTCMITRLGLVSVSKDLLGSMHPIQFGSDLNPVGEARRNVNTNYLIDRSHADYKVANEARSRIIERLETIKKLGAARVSGAESWWRGVIRAAMTDPSIVDKIFPVPDRTNTPSVNLSNTDVYVNYAFKATAPTKLSTMSNEAALAMFGPRR